jgi:hypothetical protein
MSKIYPPKLNTKMWKRWSKNDRPIFRNSVNSRKYLTRDQETDNPGQIP